jgi:phosphinothricin acetyltransferase
MMIRPATQHDLAQVTAIYAHHVLHGTGTFETEPPSELEMTQRWQDVQNKGLAYLVAESDGKVLGYAYANWFKPRPAYRFSAEDSIYMHPDAAGKGLGTQLLHELLAQLEALGVRQVLAVIGDSNNMGSVGVHQKLGFQRIGVMHSVGWKFGRWLDVVMMQKTLGKGATIAPTEENT